MQKAIIILGMHRSGTSLLAGVLEMLGINLGTNLMPPQKDNPKGFFENLRIVRINDEILSSFNCSALNVDKLPKNWYKTKDIQRYKEKIKNVVKEEFGNKDFGLKDPRLCILLPIYLKVFRELKIKPIFIKTKRKKIEIFKSLETRDKLLPKQLISLYNKYMKSMDEITKNVLTMSFDEVIKNPEKMIKKMISFIKSKSFKTKEFSKIKKRLKSFIDPKLKHHNLEYEDYINHLAEIIQRKEKSLQNKTIELAAKDAEINELKREIDGFLSSISWKLTKPLRKGYDFFKRTKLKEIKGFKLKMFKHSNRRLVFKKADKPLVSIIIPVYNKWEYTHSCLKSILKNTTNVNYEIIIADDVSTDKTKDAGRIVKNINIIRNKHNLGFLKNCNNAAKKARGKYILFLNNDTNVQKDWLKALIDLIKSDNKIGLVGSKLVYPNGKLQEAGGIIWRDASGWNYGRFQDPESPEFNYVKEVDYISGACIMISKHLWHEISGFDTRFAPAYFEDTDLAFEVRKRGLKVVYQPKSIVVHFESVSYGADKDFQLKNKDKFVKKWAGVLSRDHFNNAENIFLARDKSSKKRTIVVIDHYVPMFDKDAGSKAMFQYIKLLTKMGLNVKFIGDNFTPHEPYTSKLQQMGVEVLYGKWYKNNWSKWIKDNASYIDYFLLSRPQIGVKYINFIKSNTKAKILYFGIDLHYLRKLRFYELNKDKRFLKASNDAKKMENFIFSKADVVYYYANYEISLIKDFPKLMKRAIPLFIYDKFKKADNFNSRKDLLFVGGFNHAPNIDGVKWFIKDIWPFISKRIPNIKLYIIGSNPTNEIKKLASKNILIKGFVSDEELKGYYNNCKLMVAPLRYGAGVKGKIIESMYYGLPVVTTSIGAEGINCDSLVITDKEKAFANKVVQLYNDNKKLAELSKASLEFIKKNFSEGKAIRILSKDIKA